MIKDKEVSVTKLQKVSEYLSKVDLNEADADFVRDISEDSERIYAIFGESTVVGAAQVIAGETSYIYIYIFPEYRNCGFGSKAIGLLERIVESSQLEEIITCYRSCDSAANAFARKYGYLRNFASDYMVYSGQTVETERPCGEKTFLVRSYQDADYYQAHSLFAEAFHLMRLSTGDFPDSVVEEPSERMRENWAHTTEERLVCQLGDEIVGYAHIEGPEIGSISIKPSYQGNGIGRAFLKAVMNRMQRDGIKDISLCCVVGNTRARHLYDSMGFREVYCNDYAKKNFRKVN